MLPTDLIKKIRILELIAARNVNTLFAGDYNSSFRGKGIEFDEVREYMEGDEVRDIDWNITARTGKPYIKKYMETRELSTMFLVDMSGSMFFGSQSELKRDLVLKVCAILAFSALKNNDRVGLIIFTDRKEIFVPPKKGRTHIMRILREIVSFPVNRRKTDIKETLKHLNTVVKRHSICFLISDFLDFDAGKELKITNKRNDLVAITIRDKIEENLPKAGLVSIQDSEGEESIVVDFSDQKAREEYIRQYEFMIKKQKTFFQKLRIDQIKLFTDEDPFAALHQLFKKRTLKMGR